MNKGTAVTPVTGARAGAEDTVLPTPVVAGWEAAVDCPQTRYLQRATVAAGLERDGVYADAASHWRAAGRLARDTVSLQWCEVRETLCLRAARRAQAVLDKTRDDEKG